MEELTHIEIKVRMFNKSLFGVPNRGDRVRKIFKLLKNFSSLLPFKGLFFFFFLVLNCLHYEFELYFYNFIQEEVHNKVFATVNNWEKINLFQKGK